MGGEAEVGVGVQGFEEGLVAAQVGVGDHFREVAHRLVGMDAEEQVYSLGHGLAFQLARRIVPPLSGAPPPRLIGWSRLPGTGRRSRR